MIELKFDSPFGIGDEVWVRTYEDIYTEIECPFCHGNPEYDTGITMLKGYGIMTPIKREPWIIRCKTCGGNGKINAWTDKNHKCLRGKIVGVDDLHGSENYLDFDYIVKAIDDKSSNNSTHIVNGKNIFLEKPQMSEVD